MSRFWQRVFPDIDTTPILQEAVRKWQFSIPLRHSDESYNDYRDRVIIEYINHVDPASLDAPEPDHSVLDYSSDESDNPMVPHNPLQPPGLAIGRRRGYSDAFPTMDPKYAYGVAAGAGAAIAKYLKPNPTAGYRAPPWKRARRPRVFGSHAFSLRPRRGSYRPRPSYRRKRYTKYHTSRRRRKYRYRRR